MYDGVCNDAEVMGKLLGLDGPPTFKTTKMAKEKFEDLIGDLDVGIRYCDTTHFPCSTYSILCFSYDTLRLTSDVNIHWKPTDGTFKFSGTYGK